MVFPEAVLPLLIQILSICVLLTLCLWQQRLIARLRREIVHIEQESMMRLAELHASLPMPGSYSPSGVFTMPAGAPMPDPGIVETLLNGLIRGIITHNEFRMAMGGGELRFDGFAAKEPPVPHGGHADTDVDVNCPACLQAIKEVLGEG